jgi:hypothetical protein
MVSAAGARHARKGRPSSRADALSSARRLAINWREPSRGTTPATISSSRSTTSMGASSASAPGTPAARPGSRSGSLATCHNTQRECATSGSGQRRSSSASFLELVHALNSFTRDQRASGISSSDRKTGRPRVRNVATSSSAPVDAPPIRKIASHRSVRLNDSTDMIDP